MTELLPYILFDKYIHILALASPENPSTVPTVSAHFRSLLKCTKLRDFTLISDKESFYHVVNVIVKIFLYVYTGTGQRRESALCQLYRHTFVPYFNAIVNIRLLPRLGAALRWVSLIIRIIRRGVKSILPSVESLSIRYSGYISFNKYAKFGSVAR